MRPILTIEKKIEEHHLPLESDKAIYVTEKIGFYSGLEPMLNEADHIKYDLRITTPDSKLLWVGGAIGRVGGSACQTKGGAVPYFSFLQDIVCLWTLLGLSDSRTEKARELAEFVFEYARHLHSQGWLAEPAIEVDPSNPEAVKMAIGDLQLASAMAPAAIVIDLSERYARMVIERRGLNGNYDPSRIVEESYLALSKNDAEKPDTGDASSGESDKRTA